MTPEEMPSTAITLEAGDSLIICVHGTVSMEQASRLRREFAESLPTVKVTVIDSVQAIAVVKGDKAS